MQVTKDMKYLEIPGGLFPHLNYQFASPGLVNTASIGKDIANEYYKAQDFELLKDLYFFRFATFEQLCSLLKIEDEAAFRARLNQLLSRRIINRFTLSNDKNTSPNDEKLLVCYCLDFAGVEVLTHKYNSNNIINFDVAMNMQDSKMIGKRLFIVDFYLKLLEAVPKDDVVLFDPSPEYPINKTYEGNRATTVRFKPGFAFGVRKDGDVKCYIADIFAEEELGQELIDEIRFTDEFLPKTKIFMPSGAEDKKPVPTLLVFTAKDEDMLIATQAVLGHGQNIKLFRLSTPDRIVAGLGENGAFFKFDDASQTLKPVTMGAFKR